MDTSILDEQSYPTPTPTVEDTTLKNYVNNVVQKIYKIISQFHISPNKDTSVCLFV